MKWVTGEYLNGFRVVKTMADVMLVRGIPQHIRSDHGPELTAKIMDD